MGHYRKVWIVQTDRGHGTGAALPGAIRDAIANGGGRLLSPVIRSIVRLSVPADGGEECVAVFIVSNRLDRGSTIVERLL